MRINVSRDGNVKMKVFLTGGTGSIGTAVATALVARGDAVIALSRAVEADRKLRAFGAVPQRGDLRYAADWAHVAVACDGIIHAGATFDHDMGTTDRQVITALLQAASVSGTHPRLLFTGGCWLYGATGDRIAGEGPPFCPLPAFAAATETARIVLQSRHASAAVLHPAMVYHREGGVFEGFLAAARGNDPVPVIGSLETRWPLVHRDDLAAAYLVLLDRPDLTGHFNVAAEVGVPVRSIVAAIRKHFDHGAGTEIMPVGKVVAASGAWAAGYALDQQMAADRLRTETIWRPLVTDFRKSDLFDQWLHSRECFFNRTPHA